MNPTPVLKDAVGQEYGIGDWIAYPVRHGSCMDISHGQIVAMKYKKGWRDEVRLQLTVEGRRTTAQTYGRRRTHYTTTVYALERVIKIPVPAEK